MPLFRKSSTDGVDYKSRLEHKLYLAKEDPDPVFDLSSCNLKDVPKGVYSICKVLRTESLILHHNNLTSLSGGGLLEDLSLLKVLDISSNKFTTLPNSINSLTNLEELYLNNNLLKALPESICDLSNLRILSCPFNRLKKLPKCLPELTQLEELILQGNPAICTLPDNLSLCPSLCRLVLDIGRYTHPPNEVVLQGTKAVLSFLANEIGLDYKGVTEDHEKKTRATERILRRSTHDENIQAKIQELENKKVKKCQEYMALEKDLADTKEQELRLHGSSKEDKDKLIQNLKDHQMKIAEEVLKFQHSKETERTKLIEQLKETEVKTDEIISKVLEMNKNDREPWRIIQQQELDRAAEELLFNLSLDTELRKKDILNDMENLLLKEGDQIMKYEEERSQIVHYSLSRELEWDEQLAYLLCNQNIDRSTVIHSVGEDEKAQEVAVAKLLERSDIESELLKAQLKIIETQLAQLTNLEIKRKNLNLDALQLELAKRRGQLSELLTKVLVQRDERKAQLLTTLRRMEAIRPSASDDYWLVQYQKLLESQSMLDSTLVEQMILNGVHQHLPVLINLELENITFDTLKREGIENEDDCVNICKAVKNYLATLMEPSAPLDEPGPSAPPIELATECVICMNAECQVVYIPCGHLCCCSNCSQQILLCPLCRGEINKKIFVISNKI